MGDTVIENPEESSLEFAEGVNITSTQQNVKDIETVEGKNEQQIAVKEQTKQDNYEIDDEEQDMKIQITELKIKNRKLMESNERFMKENLEKKKEIEQLKRKHNKEVKRQKEAIDTY